MRKYTNQCYRVEEYIEEFDYQPLDEWDLENILYASAKRVCDTEYLVMGVF